MDGSRPETCDRRLHGGGAAEPRAVLVGAPGGLAAADAVDVGDAADGPAVPGERVPRGPVHERLELGQRDDAVDPVAQLAVLGAVLVEAGGDDDGADRDLDGPGALAADAEADAVVPEAAGLAHHLGAGEDRDRGALAHLGDEVLDELRALAIVRVHRAEPADPAAQLQLALHERHAQADVGQADGRPQARDAAADDEGVRDRLDDHRLERARCSGCARCRPRRGPWPWPWRRRGRPCGPTSTAPGC